MSLTLEAIEATSKRSSERLALWTALLALLEPRMVLELGVWRGQYAEQILRSCQSVERYYLLDPWRPLPAWNKPLNVDTAAFDDAYADAQRRVSFAAEKTVVLRGTTTEVIDRIDDESLDFAYIDGDHTLRGITIDLLRVYPKMKLGAWIGGDDLCSNIWQHDLRFEPTLVFPLTVHFAEGIGMELYALPFQQFLMRKPPGRGEFRFVDLAGGYGRREILPHITVRRILRLKASMLKRSIGL